jgi:hypothetical protein
MITFAEDIRDALKAKRRAKILRRLALSAGFFVAFIAGLLIDLHVNEKDLQIIDFWVSLPLVGKVGAPS